MDTLKYILKKYEIELDKDSFIVELPKSRWEDYPILLQELGMNKGVEIGVFKGKFSYILKKYNPKLDLIGIDSWSVYGDYKDFKENELEEGAYSQAKIRAEKYGITMIKATSMDAVKKFADESLDFVFIDGNHDFEHVVEDVAAWSRKVRKGGIVSGHDFIKNEKRKFGVKEAVTAWCESYQIKPLFVFMGDSCPTWAYVKQ
jgi:predicted O-methyltransferase YrrM